MSNKSDKALPKAEKLGRKGFMKFKGSYYNLTTITVEEFINLTGLDEGKLNTYKLQAGIKL